MGDIYKEKQEAIRAGEAALACLYDARDYLSSARGWGIWDILGGGFISTFIKHSKIDRAKSAIWSARMALKKFDDELDDVYTGGVDLGIGDFAVFADWFFDGLLADIYVQSKIAEAQRDVEAAIERVNTVLGRLRY